MFAELVQQLLVPAEARHDIEAKVALTGCKSRDEPIALAPALVNVMVVPKPDDAVAPHFRFAPGYALHQFEDQKTVVPLLIFLNAIQKKQLHPDHWVGFLVLPWRFPIKG